MSSVTHIDSARPTGQLMEEPTADWQPATIGDRKLLEIRTRLGKIKCLGGAFAGVDFSPEVRVRLEALDGRR